jgi:hypothetical protein
MAQQGRRTKPHVVCEQVDSNPFPVSEEQVSVLGAKPRVTAMLLRCSVLI